MIRALELLRNVYHFGGYIHVKAIPGADSELITRLGLLADRMSINIELPSQESLKLLAPDKTKESILRPMGLISTKIQENSTDLVKFRHASKFVPAGQSTQLIVGATPDTDHKILTLTEGLYKKYHLKRVFFSAYIPVAEHSLLPSIDIKPPLMREHRLYQADWLLRFYGFEAKELLDEQNPNFNLQVDPKCNWALNHLEKFPLEINKAPYEMLLRVPGIGVTSAMRILTARRGCPINFSGLKKMGIVLKRAQYFITCQGKIMDGLKITSDGAIRALMGDQYKLTSHYPEQLSLFDEPFVTREDVQQCLTRSDLVYAYDGSFVGLMCCIFESYEQKEIPNIIRPLGVQQGLFDTAKWIETNEHKSDRVFNSIPVKISSQAQELVKLGFLTCAPHKELLIYHFLRLGFKYREQGHDDAHK